jgi:uncharacterized protein
MTDSNRKPNALANESSPYLIQHAYNPVNWMPWGDEAFAKAKAEDKLVFLSIGYATCHWCHVMEHESFENDAIAAILNENFVSIKVDREERPDIDSVYMAVTQALNDGHGGWPMSVWLTPDKQPITAGTYFPAEDRHGRAGFGTVLHKLHDLWSTDRERLTAQASQLTDWLQKARETEGEHELSDDILRANAAHHAQRFDSRYGGFDGAPKFPTAHRVSTLLHWHHKTGDKEALSMAEVTLDNMARGGIHDQVGGGFHRYSTDREWLTPHFEKMLYDNALLVEAYLDAFLLTGNEDYARVVRDTCEYVLRDLRDKAGAFHSAEDADSEGEEGKFYVWTWDELGEHLGDDRDLAAFVWGCTQSGNYRDESTGELMGSNILHLPRSLEDSAKARNLSVDELRAKVGEWREKLFEVRKSRIRPLLDDKVLTDWNGLMIGAMARAGAVLDESRYVVAAQEAARFILGSMVEDGRLLHRYRDGKAGIKGFAQDYAFLVNGLVGLYQADFDSKWLKEADRLCGEMLRLFVPEGEGLLDMVGSDEEDKMIAPQRETHDGALPSSNSGAALALIRLGRLLQKSEYSDAAERILKAASAQISRMPAAHGYALQAIEWLVWPSREVVIAGEQGDETVQAMLKTVIREGHPRTLTVLNTPDGDISSIIPFAAEQKMVDNKPTAYVCENYTCKQPVTDLQKLADALSVQSVDSDG